MKVIQHNINDKYVSVEEYYGNFAMETNNGTVIVPIIYTTNLDEETK